jgi:hypothetical protein
MEIKIKIKAHISQLVNPVLLKINVLTITRNLIKLGRAHGEVNIEITTDPIMDPSTY